MASVRTEEFRGKTVEIAISAGLATLGVTREEVEVEIIRPGSRGVLGIGAEDAVVRLHVLPRSVPPEPALPAALAEIPAAPPLPKAVEEPVVREKTKTARPQAPAVPKAGPAPGAEGPVVDREAEGIEYGRQFLAGLLERLNLEAEIEIVPQSDLEAGDEERVQVLNIVGDNLGSLIGRQNEVLAAIELLTRLSVNQQTRSRNTFVVDVNGYRMRRAETLRKLALRMAEQAVQAGRTMVLEPMPPAERRLIHLALRDNPDVITQSVGEGDRRKVTIIPKKE